MASLTFAFLISPGKSERQALMLARSIRSFAGEFASSPIWGLVPEATAKLDAVIASELAALDVQQLHYPIGEDQRQFPFAAKVYASAAAEFQLAGRTQILVWMDTDSMVINEPFALTLEEGKVLGFRPVDHRLIGSLYEEPIDAFWKLVFECCQVEEARYFPITTSVDQQKIRPYFNAGMLVVRPEGGLLRSWRDNFDQTYQLEALRPFFNANRLYRIFFHQAILAGTILSTLKGQELQELPHLVNYPLHMHAGYPASLRPANINDLITCRYDTALDNADWQNILPILEPLKSWLADQLSQLGLYNDQN